MEMSKMQTNEFTFIQTQVIKRAEINGFDLGRGKP